MKLSGKKLTTAILAGLMGATMFGGSVFAEVSDQEFNEVRQGVNSKTARISQLENAQLWKLPDIPASMIPASKKDIAAEATARDAADQKLQGNINAEAQARNAADQTFAGNIDQNKTDIAANKKAIGDEAAARDAADQKLQGNIADEATARQADISRLDNKIHDVSKEVDTVGALSMAMSGLHPLSYDEGDARFQLSAAVGTYDGTEALALGGFYHFNRDSMLSVGVATDLGADEHRMGANVGYTRRIGQGGHVSRPSEGTVSDIMKDIKNLEQKQAKLEQENEQLKQQLAALKK